MKKIVLLLLASCAGYRHLPSAARSPAIAAAMAARIVVSCGSEDRTGLRTDLPGATGDWVRWGGGTASAVVWDARHLVTAAHAVACPVIPRVTAVLSDGRVRRVVVTYEDASADYAVLEVASAEPIGDHVPPPIIARGSSVRLGLVTRSGDSGRGVYDDTGRLLGTVTKSGDDVTEISPATEWRIP